MANTKRFRSSIAAAPLAAVLLVSGCTTVDGVNALSLINTSAIGPGSECAFGGSRIDIGLDNGDGGETANDGVLGAGEVDKSQFICNGGEGGQRENQIISIIDEPPGLRCPDGGRRITAGIDNGDGGGIAENQILEPGEIDEIRYVCGARIGESSIVQVTNEPAGPNCPVGGTLIETGLDNGDGAGDPGDGVLHPEEVDLGRFVCSSGDPLIDFRDEPPGANCIAGGTSIAIGLDNGEGGGVINDNILQPGEIDDEIFDCRGEDQQQLKLLFSGNLAEEFNQPKSQLRVAQYVAGSGRPDPIFVTDRCGTISGAISLDANAGEYLQVQDIRHDGDVTFSVWYKAPRVLFSGLIAQPDPVEVGLLQLFIGTADIRAEYFEPGGQSASSANAPVSGTLVWHHAVTVLDSLRGELRVSVDGGAPTVSSLMSTPAGYTGPIFFGRLRDVLGEFTGDLDNVRIFSRALSPTEVTSLFQYEAVNCD